MNQNNHLKEIFEHLTYKTRDWSFKRILTESQNGHWLYRSFNDEFTWTPVKATFFIESILLRCEMHPLILLEKSNSTIVCDGYNRLTALIQFFTNQLTLVKKGLSQLPFLANKKFQDLPKSYQTHLLELCTFKVLIYSVSERIDLTIDDYDNIEKQLYIRHNTGIQLKSYQIQKAEFCKDIITQMIYEMIQTDPQFKQQLFDLKIMKKEKDDIDKAFTNIRALIGLSYAPLDYYLKQKSKHEIAHNIYVPYTLKQNKNDIIKFFRQTIDYLHQLFQDGDIHSYPNLNRYTFVETSYWLIAIILKNNLLPLAQFNPHFYIEYCNEQDLQHQCFSKLLYSYQDKKKRFKLVVDFLKINYSISMEQYFDPIEINLESKKNIDDVPLFEELLKKSCKPTNEEKDVEEICSLIRQNSFVLRPYYQRSEQRNIRASSGIIESLLLGIRIPNILIYRYVKDNKQIYEVVDGQQRCLSLLAFLKLQYLDEFGKLQKSNKNGFKLTKLKVLTTLNQHAFEKSKYVLLDDYKKKLKQADIHLSIIDQSDNPYFDPIEHYIRINSNINPLKMDSYLMWNVSCDKIVMEQLNQATQKHINVFFPKKSKNKNYETLFTMLAYYEYQKRKSSAKVRKWRAVSNRDLTYWLEQIDDKNRFLYMDSIRKVDTQITKIEKWLDFIDETPSSLYGPRTNDYISNQKLDFLYYLLADISWEILESKHRMIQTLILDFTLKLKNANLTLIEKQEILQLTKSKIAVIQAECSKNKIPQ